ncbi:MAG: IS256 family transposase [Myxococcales bacterium]
MVDELVAGCRTEADLFGPDGVFTKLKGAVMSRLLEAEMTHHLGHERNAPRKGTNARNGHSRKTVHTETGSVVVSVPRDRDGTFEPQLIGKHQRRLDGFDEKVLALYARGMTTRDISAHLRELYGTEVSHDLISRATEHVIDEFRAWQKRPLESVYPVVYLDAIFVGVCDGAQVKKRAFYVALAMQLDGKRDVLGIWVAETEGAKFWLEIFTDLKHRGVSDILFLCADGLTGLERAIEAAFPKAVHLVDTRTGKSLGVAVLRGVCFNVLDQYDRLFALSPRSLANSLMVWSLARHSSTKTLHSSRLRFCALWLRFMLRQDRQKRALGNLGTPDGYQLRRADTRRRGR